MASRAPFLPPKLNPLVLAAAKSCLPAMFEWLAGGIEVVISEEDLRRLRQLKRQRVLLLPNHPTHFDPMVMLEISRRLEENFLFVAAREVFDRNRHLAGWLFQRCGVYSLIRGAVDRESFAMTQKILVEGKNWLVIFIEGEVSLENDTVIPFEAGVMSLALRAQETLAESSAAPIHVATVAMKTFYKPGVETAIDRAVAVLEERVGLPAALPDPNGFCGWDEMRSRIGRIGCEVLAAVEKAYLVTPKKDATLEQRLAAMKDRMLTKIENYLDIVPGPREISLLDRVRVVRNKMDRVVHAYGDLPEKLSAYDLRQLQLRQEAFLDFYNDLTRLVNFLTFRADYLARATPERFAEVVIRLEAEILGKPRLVYPRQVVVKMGEIVNLRDQLPAYREDKKKTAAALAAHFEKNMAGLLDSGNVNT